MVRARAEVQTLLRSQGVMIETQRQQIAALPRQLEWFRRQVFGQKKPVNEQNGWRHFIAERRLLRLGGPTFRAAIMRERSRGVKTEPAFATVLRLKGDSYLAILDLERCDNGRLNDLLVQAGFGSHLPATGNSQP